MRFDVTIDLCVSLDTYSETEARDLAERIAARMEVETEWAASSSLTSPLPLATVLSVVRVDDGTRG